MNQHKRFPQNKQLSSAFGSLLSTMEEAADEAQCAVRSGKPFCLSRCIHFLLSKAGVILLFALICTLLSLIVFQFVPPKYKATSKLYLLGADEAGLQLTSLQAGALLVTDYSEVLKTWEVHEAVRTRLDLDMSYTEMQNMLSVSTPTGSHLLYITITHSNPILAAELANAYASVAYSFIINDLHGLQPELFSRAIIPSRVSGLGIYSWLLLTFIAAAGAVTGVYAILFCLDDRVRTAEDLALAANARVLACIPQQMQNTASSFEKEPIYLFASQMITAQNRCILFSSPHSGSGVSHVCTELLHALGSLHQHAVLVCAEYVNDAGGQTALSFENYLQERCGWQQLVQTHQNAALLPIQGTASSLLSQLFHPRMAVLMKELRNSYDWILIDVPPLDRHAAGSALYACCDGCILVCANGSSTFQAVSDYAARLSENGKPLLGTVLNDKPITPPQKLPD